MKVSTALAATLALLVALCQGADIDFVFTNNTQGWTLGHSNGAAWKRLMTNIPPSNPTRDVALQVVNTDVYHGSVLATSPRLEIGSTGQLNISIEVYLNGSVITPCYLHLRRKLNYTTDDHIPAINLDPFGDQENYNWLTLSTTVKNLTPGQQFFFVLDGSLGLTDNNIVAVRRVTIDGASIVPVPEQSFFSFDEGLEGWSPGSMDGGRWTVYKFSELDPSLNVPPSSTGSESILWAERFDTYSGVISIESPPIVYHDNTLKDLTMVFWARGSMNYAASLRLRIKSMDGVYSDLPFVDLTNYGNVDNQQWLELEKLYTIPDDNLYDRYFQLVLEADLGSDMSNLIAVDVIRIFTRIIP